MLNRIGPSTEPCGTTEKYSSEKTRYIVNFHTLFSTLSNYGETLLCQNQDHIHAN